MNAILGAVGTKLLSWILDPRVVAALAVAGLLWAGWSHYDGLCDDLAASHAKAATEAKRADSAEEIARNNAKAALKADAGRRATVKALVDSQAQSDEFQRNANASKEAVRSAPATENGALPAMFEAYRKTEFTR